MPGLTKTIAVTLGTLVLALMPVGEAGADPSPCRGLWMCPQEAERLPTSGPAWEALVRRAQGPAKHPNLSDKDDATDVDTLARALVYARVGGQTLRRQVIEATTQVIGTEDDGSVLGLARGLVSYVIAADIVGLPAELDGRFRAWLSTVRDRPLRGRSLRETHRVRPNNWGTHAGASRLAIALYLEEPEEVARVARVFRGYLGDRAAYAGFRFGAGDWQADPLRPVGVNPAGAVLAGRDVDGVLPDDQRRCCVRFEWPPPGENYVYEALQGALVTAVMLDRAGYHDVWEWQDRALLRAFRWLHDVAEYPATGDDEWQAHIINWAYDADFPASVPARPGKALGFTDWSLAANPF